MAPPKRGDPHASFCDFLNTALSSGYPPVHGHSLSELPDSRTPEQGKEEGYRLAATIAGQACEDYGTAVPALTGERDRDIRKIRADGDRLTAEMPSNLAMVTQAQRERYVRWLATLSLEELRRRQDILHDQQGEAFRQKNAEAGESLHALENMLGDAVRRSEFDDLQYVQGPRLKDYGRRAHGVGPIVFPP